MKQRIFLFIGTYLYFILIFVLGKLIFTLVHAETGGEINFTDIINVLAHGLKLDLSAAGYLTILPALFLIASIWFKPYVIAKTFNIYLGIISLLLAIITVTDIIVYPYWGFHFDSNIFLYLKNPDGAIASASALEVAGGILGALLFAGVIYTGYLYLIKNSIMKLRVPRSIRNTGIILLMMTIALFLPIRGGVTVSTANIGKVYFSENTFLNHAAINPHFNLMYSLFKSNDFASQYQFFDKDEAAAIFEQLQARQGTDSITHVLTTDKPNIILFMLESFSYEQAMDSVIAPNMSRIASEGILFDHFYANTFRTDRAIVSILSGYPGHPSVAIMKYPQKTESLPSIPIALENAGYKQQTLYYGGDIDFANMRSYFIGACGISDVISHRNFLLNQRTTKWGVPDEFVIDKLAEDLPKEVPQEPFLKIVLTLSSHEPYDVPVSEFDEPFLNSVRYTDECIGNFVDSLKNSPLWDNTLLIFIADHAMQYYPSKISNSDSRRFHIPMIWAGGAIAEPMIVSDYGSQNDLAATLLSQVGTDYSDFKFSKDMFNKASDKFAFYAYVNGFAMMNNSSSVTYDNDMKSIIGQSGSKDLSKEAMAFFQMMYLDLGSR